MIPSHHLSPIRNGTTDPSTRWHSRTSCISLRSLGTSGLQVSKIILGCMSYGSSKWAQWVLDEAAALPLMNASHDAGINTCVPARETTRA
ncbi:hypothetical protein EXIGLDRAFT_623181 [Exidia glandulosa HHB12029]|uniref:NADP-dependent oxidoreductase domain-containing protein n=1 Tax=Exidia glandulosa HHB12029 TaxID=1314781 RepID=A0A165ZRX0_EXIGL|nr:hypothetical protein EXIGLDRAFT_623181 [Exidia glandulosa HHB12029]